MLNIHPPVDLKFRAQFRTSDAPSSWIGMEQGILWMHHEMRSLGLATVGPVRLIERVLTGPPRVSKKIEKAVCKNFRRVPS